MKILDLFSGIGGFSLGLERAGMETVAFCEFDKKAQLVLKKHWPDVPIYNDVRTLNYEQLRKDGIETIDLICGGFPCQPFSVAGKRKGEEDDRHLWPEYFRLIQEIRPRWIIGENVAGLINMGLDQVLSDMEGEGYTCQAFIVPACAVNAPHRRDRVWIIANTLCHGLLPTLHDNSYTQNKRRSEAIRRKNREFVKMGSTSSLAYSTGIRQQGQGEFNQPISAEKNEERQAIKPINGGFSEHWEIESRVDRVANGIPRGMDRLKQLGNAVVPQIPEIIGGAIMEAQNNDQN